jgi:hypothetical protein
VERERGEGGADEDAGAGTVLSVEIVCHSVLVANRTGFRVATYTDRL